MAQIRLWLDVNGPIAKGNFFKFSICYGNRNTHIKYHIFFTKPFNVHYEEYYLYFKITMYIQIKFQAHEAFV